MYRTAFLLLKSNRTALKHWGPNFFTKFLYFSGAGNLDHPSLIVDARVLAALYAKTGDHVQATFHKLSRVHLFGSLRTDAGMGPWTHDPGPSGRRG
ncbi:hypothetical protein [Arthrobacter sp. UNCCL28]|uniref:8-oxoguanine DNA glycosylase OGG fold protein n=1 Tax=Micrococcaceae TaxID=1268 RepID=UPI0034A43AE2